MKLVQMVVYKGTDFLMFTALLDSLTYGTVSNNKTTVCTVVRYVQMYNVYRYTVRTSA